jgi:uncharacterized protein YdbL (DUF1318 family)
MHRHIILVATAAIALSAAGCSPTVKVATPEPVKFDVNMRVDVYSKEDAKKKKDDDSQYQAAIDRRNRMAEVQNLKNDRVIGEDRDGYLQLRRIPEDGAYAAYAKNVMNAENNDRAVIYLSNAQKQGKPMEIVQREYALLWRDRAFQGEWVQKDDGSWIQK